MFEKEDGAREGRKMGRGDVNSRRLAKIPEANPPVPSPGIGICMPASTLLLEPWFVYVFWVLGVV